MKTKILFALICLAFQTVFAQDITGSWKAELELQGNKLPLILNVKKKTAGYSATLDSPMQNAKDIPVSKIEFVDGILSFESSVIGLKYSGTYSSEPKIQGQFSQNGFQSALTFIPLDQPVQTVGKLPADYAKNLVKLDEYLSYLEKNNVEAGKVSIFRGGKEIYQRTFGEKNLPGYNPKDNLFQIGSITKTMTAVMLHQLAERNKIDLNNKLSIYFPEVPNADKITLKQMLNHSAGLANYVDSEKEPKWLTKYYTEKEILDHIISQKAVFEPGTSTQYSNSGYYLLTKILEKATGKTFAENLSQMILKPAGLTRTFTVSSNPANVFRGFSYANGWIPVEDFDFRNVVGVGDIAADPGDLNKFISQLFSGKFLSLNTLESIKPKENDQFGLGIARVPFYNKTFYGHSGGTYGTNSLMIYNEEDQLAMSYSLNADRMGANNFAIDILSLLYGLDVKLPVVNNQKLSEADLKTFEGKYTSTQIPLGIKVFVQNGALFGQGDGQPAFPLEFVEKQTFKFDQANLKMIFLPAENKMRLIQNGVEFIYTRIKE